MKPSAIHSNFGLPKDSRVRRGKTWPATAGARRVKEFQYIGSIPTAVTGRVWTAATSTSMAAA